MNTQITLSKTISEKIESLSSEINSLVATTKDIAKICFILSNDLDEMEKEEREMYYNQIEHKTGIKRARFCQLSKIGQMIHAASLPGSDKAWMCTVRNVSNLYELRNSSDSEIEYYNYAQTFDMNTQTDIRKNHKDWECGLLEEKNNETVVEEKNNETVVEEKMDETVVEEKTDESVVINHVIDTLKQIVGQDTGYDEWLVDCINNLKTLL